MFSKPLPTLRSALVCIFSLLATASLAQTTINVGPGQPHTSIQSGIDAAVNGDTVLVAPGTYYENINFNGKAITVASSGGAASTIVDGSMNLGSTVTFATKETRASVLDGFTVDHGTFYPQSSPYSNYAGAGILTVGAAPTLQNLIVTNNACLGIEMENSAALLQHSTVSGTGAYLQGVGCYTAAGTGVQARGTYFNASTPGLQTTIVNNTITANGAISPRMTGTPAGGGIRITDGSILIQNNVITSNYSGNGIVGYCGAGIHVGGGQATIVQNLIIDNIASSLGAGIEYDDNCGRGNATIVMANNTIADNIITKTSVRYNYDGTQISFEGGGTLTLSNNIVEDAGNSGGVINCFGEMPPYFTANFDRNDFYSAQTPGTSTYCNPGTNIGNISADPVFTNAVAGMYTLLRSSPALDAGDNSASPILATDLNGSPRVQNATGTGCVIDMGAYEYPGSGGACATNETLQSSTNPSPFGQAVAFTAQLSSPNGIPTGNVQFADGSTVLGTQPISGAGVSTFTTTTLTIGSHTITATYQPTGVFTAASAALTQVVNGAPTTTTLTCSPNSIPIANTALLTVSVTSPNGTPTGSIAFTDIGAALATRPLLNGTTNLTYTALIAGPHTLTATYLPTGTFAASSASCTETVTALPSQSVLTVNPTASTYGSPVTLVAAVSAATPPGPGTPTGTVTFYNGPTAIGTGTLAAGLANLTLSNLPGPSANLTCIYSGSSVYSPSSCNTVPIVINPAASALTLSSSNNPVPALSPITFAVRLTANGQPVPAGNLITLTLNGQTIVLTTDPTGSATYTISTLTPASYPVTANFTATATLFASSASLTQVVSAIPTATTLTLAPNPAYISQQVTMLATVTSPSTQPPSGTVSFFDGSTLLGGQPLTPNGTATFTTSTLAIGNHPITATFAPATNVFLPSASPVVSEIVLPSGFTLALSPTTITLPPGTSGAATIQLASIGNFAGPLALTYGTLPTYATAAISPSSVTLTAGGTGSSTLTLKTLLKASNAVPTKPGSRALPVVFTAFTLLLLPLSFARRSNLTRLLSLALLAFALQAITGCTNAWYTALVVAPGTYRLPITATDVNHNTQTATLTVIVTP